MQEDSADYFNKTFPHFSGGTDNRHELHLGIRIDNYTPNRQDTEQGH
jgi:hypothetical protein